MEIQSVPALSIIGMFFSAFIALILPIILLVVIRKKAKAKISSFFIGSITFVLFALILESIMHSFVLGKTGDAITGNIWAYALYGGVAASLFEETGRFVAMKFCMRKSLTRENALMYGAGHGGIEAILLVGITYISNIIMSFLANTGVLETSLSLVDSTNYQQTLSQISALWTTDSSLFFLAGIERLSAITLHIALSVFVYKTVKTGNVKYLLVAYFLHFIVDAGTLLLINAIAVIWMEIILLVVVAFIAYLAYRVYKDEPIENKNIMEN